MDFFHNYQRSTSSQPTFGSFFFYKPLREGGEHFIVRQHDSKAENVWEPLTYGMLVLFSKSHDMYHCLPLLCLYVAVSHGLLCFAPPYLSPMVRSFQESVNHHYIITDYSGCREITSGLVARVTTLFAVAYQQLVALLATMATSHSIDMFKRV